MRRSANTQLGRLVSRGLLSVERLVLLSATFWGNRIDGVFAEILLVPLKVAVEVVGVKVVQHTHRGDRDVCLVLLVFSAKEYLAVYLAIVALHNLAPLVSTSADAEAKAFSLVAVRFVL